MDAAAGQEILDLAETGAIAFAEVDDLGSIHRNDAYIDMHIDEILDLDLVNTDLIKKAGFKVVVDGVKLYRRNCSPITFRSIGSSAGEVILHPQWRVFLITPSL